MKKVGVFFLIIIFIIMNSLFGVNDLFEYKLKTQKELNPDKTWINLEVDKSFGIKNESEESFLKMPSCLKVFNDKIVIIDNNQHKLKIFSKKGEFERSVGQLGTGPGDLFYPFWVEFFNDEIYIRSNNGVDIFDKNFTFKKRIRIFFSSPLFSIFENHIYLSLKDGYREQFPLFLKTDIYGRVVGFALDDDMQDSFLRRSNISYILFSNDLIIVIPKHWNKIYVYDQNLKLVNKTKINYPMLDKIADWNNSEINKKKNSSVTWPCNMIASAKFFQGELYLFLNIPRLEIIKVDFKTGNVKNHYYNAYDFKFMAWIDFDIKNENNQMVFYMLGNSVVEDERKSESLEYNVFKTVVANNNVSRSN